MAFGFLSVFLAAWVLLLVYNNLNFKIKFKLNSKKVKLKQISPLFVVYMGIFEAFILPVMIYLLTLNYFLDGLISGFIGGAIAWFIVNKILAKKPLEISL